MEGQRWRSDSAALLKEGHMTIAKVPGWEATVPGSARSGALLSSRTRTPRQP
eukprot:CAMPEP_0179156838 /NCGR_PEP_ID=MMETSP0796-20121207/76471_1 /TAXON_ID=73915 /ORGANISM="Pyrodinium bahamense, Strain pbaha01" /LENGTH=51 /DNA_ID=CAMNT_0020858431 /DNA_START=6 /DNA_END=158 /DNA_ORIENTATION=-